MRAIMVLALGGAMLLGCRTPQPSDSAEESAANAVNESVTPVEQATAVTPSTGTIASVNPGLRFVVVDFSFNPSPRVDQRMNVYRDGQKVGEIRISRQARNSIVAADITAGEARVGDEVRPD